MTKHTTQIIDTIILTVAAVFFFVFAVLFAADEPAPGAFIILLFLSIASFGLAGYRISHKA